jgi:hypothetical protein
MAKKGNEFACFQTVVSHFPVSQLHIHLDGLLIFTGAPSITQCSIRFHWMAARICVII